MAKEHIEQHRQQSDNGGADQVQQRVEKEQEQGFRGLGTDPTPNENYTVKGVTQGKPTPETDDDHAEKVRRELRQQERERSQRG